jgi:hypothetical protein
MLPDVRVTVPAVVLNAPKLSTPPVRFTGEVAKAFNVPTCREPAFTLMPPFVDKAFESLTVPALSGLPMLIGLLLAVQAPEKSRVPPVAACNERAADPSTRVTGPLKKAVPAVPEDASVAV